MSSNKSKRNVFSDDGEPPFTTGNTNTRSYIRVFVQNLSSHSASGTTLALPAIAKHPRSETEWEGKCSDWRSCVEGFVDGFCSKILLHPSCTELMQSNGFLIIM